MKLITKCFSVESRLTNTQKAWTSSQCLRDSWKRRWQVWHFVKSVCLIINISYCFLSVYLYYLIVLQEIFTRLLFLGSKLSFLLRVEIPFILIYGINLSFVSSLRREVGAGDIDLNIKFDIFWNGQFESIISWLNLSIGRLFPHGQSRYFKIRSRHPFWATLKITHLIIKKV